MEPRGQELISRYRAKFGLPEDIFITEEMISRHWELEKSLRIKLLESDPKNRWEVFEKCYSELYREIDWLTPFTHAGRNDPPSVVYANWIEVIGLPPLKVYEIGSGKGEFIHYLATCGFKCKATEITRERGEGWISAHPNLSWTSSDGVHLDRFESRGSYDLVISSNVIEHMHPDDMLDHFRGVFSILSMGGRYIFSTPHASLGPGDVSSIFKCETLLGMHLKEYNYYEIASLLRQAGFGNIYSVLRFPITIRKRFGWRLKPKISCSYLTYLVFLEKLMEKIHSQRWRRNVAKLLTIVLFGPSILVIAEKNRFRQIAYGHIFVPEFLSVLIPLTF